MNHTCGDVYNVFFNPGEVAEIRAFGLSKSNKAWEGWAGGGGIVYGYFDNAEAFGRAAEGLDKARAEGVYFTLNPVIPDLLARAANRLKAAGKKTITTSDRDIRCIRWLPIDLDPIRPSGISSTEPELQEALALRQRIEAWMGQNGWKTGLKAHSGNGAHLLYRLPDLENTEETTQGIKKALMAIENEFKNLKVSIDLAVFNPARIWKLYGTTARKGDHVPLRPHRRSYIEDM